MRILIYAGEKFRKFLYAAVLDFISFKISAGIAKSFVSISFTESRTSGFNFPSLASHRNLSILACEYLLPGFLRENLYRRIRIIYSPDCAVNPAKREGLFDSVIISYPGFTRRDFRKQGPDLSLYRSCSQATHATPPCSERRVFL